MKNFLTLTLCSLIIFSCATAQSSSKKKSNAKTAQTSPPAPKKKQGKIKDYAKVITKDAITDEGLFNVHMVGEKYYYEIPIEYLNTDMLLVSRFSKLPSNLGGGYVNAGTKTNTRMINWERFKNKILIKEKSSSAVAADSLPINVSVKANNYEPTLFAFDIEAFSKDSSSVVIDVTKFYSTDVKAISGLGSRLRTMYKVRNLDNSRSFINSMKSFPKNIEVIQDFTYNATNPPVNTGDQTISIQMNQSMILLPKVPMQPRYFDDRVGWFTLSQYDYSSEELKADRKTYLRRWKLIPKDIEAYKRGELVEPVKPIVYYLDPATPEKFRSYMKDGIELWQKAFEAAGFKNAIIAKDPPTKEEDPEFSPEDIRYSVVRYVASTTRNATGPSVSDPRSGEIIESDIIWYHNHLRSYRNRYLLETGAANPSARTLNTPDEEIGEMMKMVIAHEVGHTLGLPHNMSASYAYDVESYRDGAFTQKNGIAATIMDYARYNYIAQPGDTNIRFVRQLGPYDDYAINFGYRYIPGANSPDEEKEILNSWIMEKAGDPKYKFGKQSSRFDPTAQTEDIGNNSIKASTYGLKNLKIVAKNLPSWTSDKTDNYEDLSELYGEMLGVWSRYVGHVVTHVGGVVEDTKNPSQEGEVYGPVDKAYQKSAMQWLQKNAFATPEWLLDDAILKNINYAGYTDRIRSLQSRHLNNLLNFERLGRLIDHKAMDAKNYSALDMLRDLRIGLWSETRAGSNVTVYRRNLQRAYLDRMAYLMTEELNPQRSRQYFNVNQSDVRALVRGELNQLKSVLSSASKSALNTETKYHYRDCIERIKNVLDPK
ncbi:zinc-dependent metalloprotease [Winogradskyella echinorum]|uniref:Zinc-dependent metalloprotease n=1 Tax=Winogradskyella echinorum TaxID=538189 RepID=A0ABR6Y210_9FLAO|nr:zinc-dependent metalloprotease [Winogradskyella echinorum]MBC3846273.1 zinc-dependent metalloprotease [Winogradskyella echinorum]MBC5750621.1 zinc-dependent metalloprotease [Winogradskyella echinorum]